MKRKVPLLYILVVTLLMGNFSLYAGIPLSEGIGASLDILWYGSIPNEFHEDELPIRTHFSLGGTIIPVLFGIGESTELSAGLSGYYTTRSLLYGTTLWRPFIAGGPTIDCTIHFNPSFSGSIGTALLLGTYLPTWELAPIWRIQVAGEYELTQGAQQNRFSIRVPLAVDVRQDYASITTGIGFKWKLDRTQQERFQ